MQHNINQTTQLTKYLITNKIFTETKLNAAITAADLAQQSLITYFVTHKMILADKLVQIIAEIFNLPVIDLLKYSIANLPLHLVPIELIISANILPLKQEDTNLMIAMLDPGDLKTIAMLKFHTGLHPKICLARYDHLQQLLQQIMTQHDTKALDMLENSSANSQPNYQIDFTTNDDEPLVRFVNNMIEDAVNKNASDIHFEVYEQYCRVRFRQDGILYEITRPPVHIASRLVARLKIMAQLDISERRIPQDGHCKIKLNRGGIVELRVNSCPTIFGEKIVLRLLNSNNTLRNIQQLDFNTQQQKTFLQAIGKPQGLILVTGPTGSGKTVTLYAALQYLNKSEKNISTIEDPVEINIANINQVHVNFKTGLTFSVALRAFLRQDPDIIMVGEIRDLETAEIAVKAAQTGHLVISTLHTNSSVEALTRLRNMGIAAYNVISSISLITAQRLLRKLCPHCKKPQKITLALQQQFNLTSADKIFQATGCSRCVKGYCGRMAIHEVLAINEDLHEPILQGHTSVLADKLSQQDNFLNLQQAGLQKVIQGLTSVDEVLRVINA